VDEKVRNGLAGTTQRWQVEKLLSGTSVQLKGLASDGKLILEKEIAVASK